VLLSQRRGFTLLELLTVVIIVGILTSGAIPQFTNFVEKSRGAEASTNLGAIRTGVLAFQHENSSNPSSLSNLLVTVNNTSDWSFVLTNDVAIAIKARDPNKGSTVTMDVNGRFGGTWPFVPGN